MNECKCLLLLLLFEGHGVLLQGSSVHQMDILSPVKATASSTYETLSGLRFAPQLAIQADTGYVWANCFISKREQNPWFRLEFKSMASIFNVRLGVITQRSGKMPKDYNLAGMANLSVYVSMSPGLGSSGKTICGSSWTYKQSKIIDLDCGRNLSGKFIHVIVPSSSPTYLLICSIVLNKVDGSLHALNLSKQRPTFTSSRIDSIQPAGATVDGKPASCSSFSGTGKTWLRVDIQTVRYISMFRFLFFEDSGTGAIIRVGQSLRNNGALDNENCGTVSTDVSASYWKNVTCSQPILGQFIYIESTANSMKICELQVFYGNILNIYSSVHVTASDQKEEYGSIWKPIDGVFGVAVEASWISLKLSHSWCRMEFNHRSAISRVVIHTPSFSNNTRLLKKLNMNGFAVYIGDFAVGNGSTNDMCGEPWKALLIDVIEFNCITHPVGKYLYVAAGNVAEASLYLTEIQVYGCEEPNVFVSSIVSNRIQKAINLTCQVSLSGCPATDVDWTDPYGNTVKSAFKNRQIDKTVSTVEVNGTTSKGLYICTAHYTGGTSTRVYNYTGFVSLSATTVPTSRGSKASAGSISSLRGSITGSSIFSVASTLTSESTTTPSKGSSSVNVAAIAVPVITAIIFLLMIILISVIKTQRRRSVKKECEPYDVGQFDDNEMVIGAENSSDTKSSDADARKTEMKLVRKPVEMVDFENHVEQMHENENHGFSLEYPLLWRETGQPRIFAAKLRSNKAKNRYPNIVPYDHSRVILKELPDVHGSDYINASYINAYGQPKGYIACQGPITATIADFWRMIWQENIHTVVVVTNLIEKGGKIKCSCYWPRIKQKRSYDHVTVTFEEERIFSECTVRTFKLTHSEKDDSESRTVTQFHFTGWPDHGVPSYATSLLNFLKRVRTHHDCLTMQSPMVVHCSAGVGRTGAFIAVDYCSQMLKQEKRVDIFNLVRELRDQRPSMVQKIDQYVFCHDAVLEVMLCGDTSVAAPDFRTHIFMLKKADPSTGKTGFNDQLELLKKVSPSKECFSYSGGRLNNARKNRYNTCIPPDESRVLLKEVPHLLPDSTYICATSVDGYRQKNRYITTQGPLKETVNDFWRLIWEKNIEFIAMVTRLEDNGEEMSVQYWPSEGTANYNLVSVTLQDEKSEGNYVIRKFSLTNKASLKIVTQFQHLNWSVGHLPDSPPHLLDMMNEMQRAQQQSDNKTVVVVCNDGVNRCGIFCAISIIVEMLKTEQIADIFQVVKALRLNNPDFVTGLMEYEFCYNMALVFLESFAEYANFKLL